jgi:hypothetical protein
MTHAGLLLSKAMMRPSLFLSPSSSGPALDRAEARPAGAILGEANHAQTTVSTGMKTFLLPMPLIGLFAGTRALLGVGVGLLLADRLSEKKRRKAGRMLLALGALSTIPLAVSIFARRKS